jgi:hypothetical protein
MDCMLSGASVHCRGWELKNGICDQSWCYVDDPLTKWQQGVGGGKLFTATQNSQYKSLLSEWCLSLIQAPHFWLRFSSESPCLVKHHEHPAFPLTSLPNMVKPSTVVALQTPFDEWLLWLYMSLYTGVYWQTGTSCLAQFKKQKHHAVILLGCLCSIVQYWV